jgi:hypothetical protein
MSPASKGCEVSQRIDRGCWSGGQHQHYLADRSDNHMQRTLLSSSVFLTSTTYDSVSGRLKRWCFYHLFVDRSATLFSWATRSSCYRLRAPLELARSWITWALSTQGNIRLIKNCMVPVKVVMCITNSSLGRILYRSSARCTSTTQTLVSRADDSRGKIREPWVWKSVIANSQTFSR